VEVEEEEEVMDREDKLDIGHRLLRIKSLGMLVRANAEQGWI